MRVAQALCILLPILMLLTGCGRSPAIASGDTVLVTYTGSLEDGTVFDTNDLATAMRTGLFDAKRAYEPLNVSIGAGQVIPGFEEALIGMRKGETKRVTLPPEQAYGNRSESKTASISRIQEKPRVVRLSRELHVPLGVFYGDHPDATIGEQVAQGGLNYTLLSLSLGNATLRLDAKPGQALHLPDALWPSTVLNVTDSSITVRQDPVDGETVTTPLGEALVEVHQASIRTKLLVEKGAFVSTRFGTGVISSVNETDAVVDFNHPLAGKTLVFDLRVVEVVKKK